LAQQGEEYDVANGALIGEQHDHAIDADAHAALPAGEIA